MPGYPAVMAGDQEKVVAWFEYLLGEPATVLEVQAPGSISSCSTPRLFDRAGGPYLDPTGKDYPDNWRRFAALSLAGADIAAGPCPAGARSRPRP
jgi:starch synthase